MDIDNDSPTSSSSTAISATLALLGGDTTKASVRARVAREMAAVYFMVVGS